MNFDTQQIMAKLTDGLDQIAALAVAYSFSVLGAIILLIAGFIVARWAENWSYRGFGRIRGFDQTLQRFLSKLLRYTVLSLVLVTVLAQFGVQTASIIAALGAAGLAIGLALQGTLQNVAAGIMLLVLKPFRAGEYVSAGDVSGTVVEIGLFATELKTFDGIFVLAPNSELWNTSVTNYTRNPQRMHGVEVGIGYDDDIDTARETLIEVARGDERVLAEPAPIAFVNGYGDNSINLTLRYWTKSPDWWATRLDITKAVKPAFDRRGISIPFPQRDIHLYPVDAKAAAK